MITDLVQIRRLGEKKKAENLRFRAWIKSHNYVERQFIRAGQEIEDQIDCRECGECCRVGEVELAERDAEKLAKFLGMPPKMFVAQHTAVDEDGKPILKRTEQGCTFLVGNECTVYDARPGACERFPHIVKGSGSLASRLWKLVDRAGYCPIVYNWMETVKGLTNFRDHLPK